MNEIAGFKLLIKCRLPAVHTQHADIFDGDAELMNQILCIGYIRQFNVLNPVFTQVHEQFNLNLHSRSFW